MSTVITFKIPKATPPVAKPPQKISFIRSSSKPAVVANTPIIEVPVISMSLPISFAEPSDKPIVRPGVSDGFLKANGVYRTLDRIVKPYFTITGKPVMRECDGGGQYRRWRLDVPLKDGTRYMQPAGSEPYAYVAPQFASLTFSSGADYFVGVEGGFKALSLMEAGIPAIGIPGINGAFLNGQLVPGLREAVQLMALKRFVFLGDGDTSLLFDFSREAAKLAKALTPVIVLLPRIGLDGPGKGIDDCREALGAKFPAYWERLVEDAEVVATDDRAEDLAARLFARESDDAIRKTAIL